MSADHSTIPSPKGKPAQADTQPDTRKPERPEGSPLFWHATGRWAKKIRGKLHYFGRGSHDEALTLYNQQADDLHAGRVPSDEPEGLTVYQLMAKFLTAKLGQRDNGELSPRTYAEYEALCRRLVKAFGRGRLVSDLRPTDFGKLRAAMAKQWGPVRLKTEIIRSRTPFNWALKNSLLDRPVMFGDAFSVPSAKVLRVHKAKRGPKMFEADEIRTMLDAAGQPLRTMILLALNAGYGNNDVATLPIAALDLDGGWISHARPKTGIGRRCPLWPETVAALREWLTVRAEPKEAAHAGLVFITYKRGSWSDDGDNRALSHEMRKLLDRLGIDGHRGFYSLRHTFQTVGDECGDFIAVRMLMGHTFGGDISAIYRERVSDERLKKVTDHLHDWLFPEPERKVALDPKPKQAGNPEHEKPRLKIVS
jgi:integrase